MMPPGRRLWPSTSIAQRKVLELGFPIQVFHLPLADGGLGRLRMYAGFPLHLGYTTFHLPVAQAHSLHVICIEVG
ncbi:hypothetical protein DFAR_910008 [Desulfarculales bacterium]